MATNLQELCLALVGHAVKTHLEPKCNNVPLWDNGLGKLAERLVKASVPNLTGDDVAAGVLAAMGVGRSRGGGLRYQAGQPGKVIDTHAEVIR